MELPPLLSLTQNSSLIEVITVSGAAIILGLGLKWIKSWREEKYNDPRGRLHRPRTTRHIRKR